jgi:hypothetical protein
MQVQMARELGLNPIKLGKLDNHKQESWKLPLPQFIEEIYYKRFKKEQPDNVRSIEEMAKNHKEKREEKKLKAIQPGSEADLAHLQICPIVPVQSGNDEG